MSFHNPSTQKKGHKRPAADTNPHPVIRLKSPDFLWEQQICMEIRVRKYALYISLQIFSLHFSIHKS